MNPARPQLVILFYFMVLCGCYRCSSNMLHNEKLVLVRRLELDLFIKEGIDRNHLKARSHCILRQHCSVDHDRCISNTQRANIDLVYRVMLQSLLMSMVCQMVSVVCVVTRVGASTLDGLVADQMDT